MIATLTMDDQGRLVLPKAILEMLSLEPGTTVQAEISDGRLEILQELETITGTIQDKGRRVLAPSHREVDVAAAVKSTRDALAERGARRSG